MRFICLILGLMFFSGFFGKDVYAQPQKCKTECQEQYVRQFAIALSKNRPSMADYFALFSEPEGPEGMRLFNIKKRRLILVKDKLQIQEMTLAGDAFDEVTNKDRASRSAYLTCVHRRYANHLPSEDANLTRSIDTNSQLTVITLPTGNSQWRFFFSDGESRPDSVIAPDEVSLGDMEKDPCVLPPGT